MSMPNGGCLGRERELGEIDPRGNSMPQRFPVSHTHFFPHYLCLTLLVAENGLHRSKETHWGSGCLPQREETNVSLLQESL